jgi:predicted transcriptional regulator
MREYITVLVDRCTMQIILEPFFANCTLAKAKKLFGYIFQEPWRNEETINTLLEFLPEKENEANRRWGQASADYQNGYKETKFIYGLTPEEKRKIERQNKLLLNAVKTCKAEYERRKKIHSLFATIKSKQ